MIHSFHLSVQAFNQTADGKKTIESRLYDKKRQSIQLGNKITFINIEDNKQTITVQVIGLLRYSSFRELFVQNEPRKFGGKDAKQLEDQINQFYTIEDQLKCGVIGIEFKLIQINEEHL